MNSNRTIYRRNLAYFKRYYRLIAISVAVAVAVIVGSLVVGDSVRGTLRGLVTERLGDTQTIIFSQESFLSERLLEEPLLAEADGYLISEGFISHNGKLLPVMVWGTDEERLPDGSVINEPLAEELGGVPAGELVLRLPSTGLVPSGSMFVTDTYTTSIRVAIGGVISPEQGGNLNLRTEQVQPFNIFVPRRDLAEVMAVEGRINLIMSRGEISEEQFADAWRAEDSGLRLTPREGGVELTSSRIFLQEQVVDAVRRDNPTSNLLYSYLGNSIKSAAGEVVYSFVTAIERYGGRELAPDEAILSDYTAQRLGVKVGDPISLSYFLAGDWKNLSTDSVSLRVGRIVPLEELVADKSLSAEFPGLSDVERCTEWDSDLPLDMDLITDEDEDYWSRYRQTPKILLPYVAVAEAWSDDYGSATAIRIAESEANLSALEPAMFGVQVIHPQQASMAAAENGVDFAMLFLALGCFIVASALLLQLGPLSEMYEQRSEEILTLSMMGFSRRRIARMLWGEALPVVGIGAVIGVVGGVIYTVVILWLLESVWHGATHTAAFILNIEPVTLLVGVVSGLILTLGVLAWAVRSALREEKTEKKSRQTKPTVGYARSVVAALLAVALYIYVVVGNGSVMIAVVAGFMAMVAAVSWIDSRMVTRHLSDSRRTEVDGERLAAASLYARRRQILLSLLTMTFGVFIVFVVGLNRRSFGDAASVREATGGYTLWCETSVPLQHDPSSESGREELGIATEWLPEMEVMPCYRFVADDASCLNLNKVAVPTVLGVDFEAMGQRDFAIGRSIFEGDVIVGLSQPMGEDVYPALVDETVLMWSLGKKLGDRIEYTAQDGRTVTVVLAATLEGSLFHGNILIDRSLFDRVWPETNGCSVFLVQTATDDDAIASAKEYLSQSLYEYGIRVTASGDRLKSINEVTDTYLSIFMTLGSVGLLLGLLSFVIIIRKNLTRSAGDIRQYLLLGFAKSDVARMLYRENVFAPQWAIVVGVVGAIIGIGRQWSAVGVWIWIGGAVVVAAMWFMTTRFVRREVERCMEQFDESNINLK